MHLPDFLKEDWMKKTDIRLSTDDEIASLLEIIITAYTPIEFILGRKPRGMLETSEKIKERIDNGTIYSILFEGELIGTFTIKRNEKYNLMEVQKVAVKQKMQNKGFGSFIMETAEHLVRLMEERKIIIETYEDHKQLVDFYLHRGYKTIDQKERKGNIVLTMEKKLWRED
ncbi:MAG TPA: GNAT family N-acetyltransferase [candidate division Zixibacteria bacterium]|nr:GNAT family N-acetyltransferase [candidate division Zixibacteria bacterium]